MLAEALLGEADQDHELLGIQGWGTCRMSSFGSFGTCYFVLTRTAVLARTGRRPRPTPNDHAWSRAIT